MASPAPRSLLRAGLHAPSSTTPPVTPVRRLRTVVAAAIEGLAMPFAGLGLRGLAVETVEVALAGLPPAFEGYRIAFLTDLHASPIVRRPWLESAFAAARGLEPDLIALGGDLVSSSPRHIVPVERVLAAARAPDGVVAVLGNHDHYVGAARVRAALGRAGVRELRNASLVIEREGSRIAVAGVGDLCQDAIDFEAAVGGIAPDVARVVLSHNPDVFAHWPEHLRLDLMLSGHTHGGQARLPFIGPPLIPSHFGYGAGLFRQEGRQLYVSRGVGALLVPVRWGCRPELSLVVLRGEDRG
jgi:predicted MPP superfamily phosphohydrolase